MNFKLDKKITKRLITDEENVGSETSIDSKDCLFSIIFWLHFGIKITFKVIMLRVYF